MMLNKVARELRNHAPFTFFGSLTGIVVMIVFQGIPRGMAYDIFYVLHPVHVLLSALVTASMYKLHQCPSVNARCLKGGCNLWALLLVGYIGSVGIATLSDSLIPYIGEVLLGLPNKGVHIGFIEKWWLVNPLAVIGIAIACLWPTTRFPHAAHVLISTWASLFHIIMALGGAISWLLTLIIFVFLFLAVWLPCCVSDIVFPLMFVKEAEERGR